MVIAGEYSVGLQILNHHVAFSANRGAPVAWVKLDPAMAVFLALGIGFGIFFIIGHVLFFLLIVALIIGIATRRRRWGHRGMGPWGYGYGHGYWGGQQASRAAETVPE